MNVYEANRITVPEGSVRRILDKYNRVLWENKNAIPFYVVNTTDYNRVLKITKHDSSAPSIRIEYSTNMRDWEVLGNTSTDGLTRTLSPGSKLYLRASTNRWRNPGTDATVKEGWYNYITGVPKIGGNIMSLLYGSEFTGDEKDFKSYSATHHGYEFSHLFNGNTELTDASELILPATTLHASCYANMFYNCISLKIAPTLPATTLDSGCYYSMFYGCYNLNYIKCLATRRYSTPTRNWVYGVTSSSGTFVKDAKANWSTGVDGIPEGWKVEDA